MQAAAKPRVVKNWTGRSSPDWQLEVGPPWHQTTSGGATSDESASESEPVPPRVGRYSVPNTGRPDRPRNEKGSPRAMSSGPKPAPPVALGLRRGAAPAPGRHTQTAGD